MKSLALFLALGVAAHATPYVFNLSGKANYAAGSTPFAIGDTFTASITIDTDATDLETADPTLGRYNLGTPSLIQFSNGLTFSNLPFQYIVANDYTLTLPTATTTYDAIAFYFYQPTFQLGFELRFGTDAFVNDFALTPTLQALIPQGSAELPGPTDWYYFTNDGHAGGPINSITGQSAAVPDGVSVFWLFAPALGVLVLLRRGFQPTAG